MDKATLENLEIFDWPNYAEAFNRADLLLGNGFSINLSPEFSYSSLFEEFLATCSGADRARFCAFRTGNFEAIQRELQAAERVNALFEIDSPQVTASIQLLRQGLIKAIREKHPQASAINKERIAALTKQLETFSNIFTLNYDLYLYHIIMAVRDRYGDPIDPIRFAYNDYFWSRDVDDARYLDFVNYQKYSFFKHAYYLHGALFLFPGPLNDKKLRRQDAKELIDCVAEQIALGNMPLFVSEGRWQEKVNVIMHSPYLRFAYEGLCGARRKVVIFGTSLAEEQDKHIIDALNARNRSLAVAIYVNDRSTDQLKSETHAFRSKFPRHDIIFFDSATLFKFT